MAVDYHSKPLLTCRVPAESLDWARAEAARLGQPFGDFIDSLIADRRAMVANQVDNHAAAPPRRPAHAPNCKCLTCNPPEGENP